MVNHENLQFKAGNPGAVQYGNFINYYQFHPPEERIRLLPRNVWKSNEPCAALDIGCNAGDLTQALYLFLQNNVTEDCSIFGIDIDPVLIRRAEETNTIDNISFQCLDFMDHNKREEIMKKHLALHKVDKFNVAFCFSTTMWIHLNHGDEGLKRFLRDVANLCEILVIEPQPWKCYRTAVKRMKQCNFMFPLFSEIKIRKNIEDEIENFLITECNMQKLVESNRTTWDRRLIVFKR